PPLRGAPSVIYRPSANDNRFAALRSAMVCMVILLSSPICLGSFIANGPPQGCAARAAALQRASVGAGSPGGLVLPCGRLARCGQHVLAAPLLCGRME